MLKYNFGESEKTMRIWFAFDPDKSYNAKYEVCPDCMGQGKSSDYLGAFTPDEIDDNREFMEDYFQGKFDRPCERCSGKRVVMVIDPDDNTPEDLAEFQRILDSIMETYYMQLEEMRYGA